MMGRYLENEIFIGDTKTRSAVMKCHACGRLHEYMAAFINDCDKHEALSVMQRCHHCARYELQGSTWYDLDKKVFAFLEEINQDHSVMYFYADYLIEEYESDLRIHHVKVYADYMMLGKHTVKRHRKISNVGSLFTLIREINYD